MRFLINLLGLCCMAYTAWDLYLGDPNPQVQIVEKRVPIVVERVVVARPTHRGSTRIVVGDPNYQGEDRVVWEAPPRE